MTTSEEILKWFDENKDWFKPTSISKKLKIDKGNFSRYLKSGIPEKYLIPIMEIIMPLGFTLDKIIAECTALINQLIREQGPAPEGAQYFIVENTGHDFGVYYEAGIFYQQVQEPYFFDIETEEEPQTPSEIYALNLESNIPDKWDSEALQELRKAGHPAHQPAKVVKMNAA